MSRPRTAALAVLTAVLLPSACAAGLLDDTDTGAVLTRPPVATVSIDPTPPVDFTRASGKVAPVRPSKTHRPTRRTTTTSSTTPPVPASARCPGIWGQARTAGWPEWALPTVDYLVWRESRCTPTARSTTRDTGLLQINDVHLGWLADHGISQPALTNPETNLRAGWLLYLQAERMFGCGWQPWTIRGVWSAC